MKQLNTKRWNRSLIDWLMSQVIFQVENVTFIRRKHHEISWLIAWLSSLFSWRHKIVYRIVSNKIAA